MKKLAILKTGSTYDHIRAEYGDFEDWFRAGLGTGLAIEVVDVSRQEHPGEPRDWDGVLVTGSPAMVSQREPWSEQTAEWLARAVAASLPVLGVCYGHQLLAHGLGGRADDRPQGRESGTFEIRLLPEAADDPLFGQLPDRFLAHLTHRQSALSLPTGAVRLAHSEHEPNQAFRLGPCAWGVQFHPEFTPQVMTAYLRTQADALSAEGQSPEDLLAGVRPSEAAASLLARFGELVKRGV
ncbi:MAG: glutamine amidotransferase [Marinobacter sp.]|uniref:glutamine amidotransferase n=1 Tax=Marinobacter sp. TaxID=50741 RepID=UPI00299D5272|nr:glutamine amidotransferase [Marinobacter sp.]MDX1633604.1 glutamine amidotransferase [Marinobacter sp.]